MLRPERMSKVSVAGSRGVMPAAIETIHGLRLVHLSDYDGSWEGFDNGTPIEGADAASERLVTVRALESTLGLSEESAAARPLGDDWEDRLEGIRTRVNDLDDRRSEVRDDLRRVEERIDRVAPFAELGIDLDLLSGYESVDVRVVDGPREAIEAALEAAEGIRAFETFTGGDVVAIVAAPVEGVDEAPIDDALVGVDLTRHEVPETEQSPSAYVDDLEERRRELEAEIDEIDADLERIADEDGEFLRRVEVELTVEVQQAEAPLQFATTDRAFVAEGWIPTAEYDRLVAALEDAVGESVEVEELERAAYDRHGAHVHTEDVQHGAPAAEDDDEEAAEADESQQTAVTDGGSAVTMDDEPPVVQDNPSPAKPFEALVNAVSVPKYSELDPTITLLLTFPLFFGFMIGDLGYGILYVAIGYYMYSNFDSPGVVSLGGVAIWAGAFTAIFGVLYGEIFGLHVLGEYVWGGHPPIEKGLSPATIDYALAWITACLIVGVAHLTLGYLLDFYENLSHGFWDALTHSGSWVLMLVGLWTWVFSRHGAGIKPDFMFQVFDGEPFALGFSGFPAMILFTIPVPMLGDVPLTLPLLVLLIGLVLLAIGDPVELVESLSILSETFSYTRMAAVLLAKAGMALVVNLMFFGMYTHDGEFHYMTAHGPEWVTQEYGADAIVFAGLSNIGIAGLVFGLVVLVFGHLLVLALGVTSAGLQAVRLEYVEFFGKFYEGGGENYEPFGTDRNHIEE